jgi:hypothetical protein
VSLQDAKLGLALLQDPGTGGSFVGLQAGAASASLEGVPGLTLEGSNLSLTLNMGPGTGALAGRVVDFSQGDIDANDVKDGSTPLMLQGTRVATLRAATPQIQAEGDFTIELRTPGAASTDPALLSGNATVSIEQSANGPMKIGATGLSALINVAGQSAGVVDGQMGLVLPGSGYALDLQASLRLPIPGLNGTALVGDVDLALNRTGQALNQTITVGGQDVSVRFARAADVTDFAVSNIDVSIEGRLGDLLKGVAQELSRANAYLLADEDLPLIGRSLEDLLQISDELSIGQHVIDYIDQNPAAFGSAGVPTLRGLEAYLRANWKPSSATSDPAGPLR